ncbi:MAG: archaemetzincin family Zn-dependent metalloprotease [Methanomicrobiales archaeon]|nr:archaemetzincin family Zn-dependent metalloprotease [Methanomicrobiales archaeon]
MGITIFWDRSAPQGLQLPAARTISMILAAPVDVQENTVFLNGFDTVRNQCDAGMILNRMQLFVKRHHCTEPILLVIQQDLYTPGTDFVFGLARNAAGAAVLSVARLDNRYYGRTADDAELVDRIAKEGAHEVGHLQGLPHCNDPECVMFQPRTLDELDRKRKALCPTCLALKQTLLSSGSSS